VRIREERAEAGRAAKARAKVKPKREPKAAARAPQRQESKDQDRRARRLETEIERAEAELAAIEQELADPQAWNDPRSAARSTRKHADAKARIEALYAQLEAVAG
jgi:ATP-binding cassette subfamily F protein 3